MFVVCMRNGPRYAVCGEGGARDGPRGSAYLVIHPSGRKGWAFRYRWRGRPRNLTFDKPYPEMGLAAARAEAEAQRDELKNDRDPAATQGKEIAQAQPNTVKSVLEEWLTRYVKPNTAEKTADEFERILNRDILPAWRDKYIRRNKVFNTLFLVRPGRSDAVT
jgi:hypothetical protein